MAIKRKNDRPFLQALLALLALATAGCAGQGMLYTRVVKPFSRDFHSTPIGSKVCNVKEFAFEEPVSGAGISVIFSLRAVQEAARQAGITNLYYADMEYFSILKGIYKRNKLILYGD